MDQQARKLFFEGVRAVILIAPGIAPFGLIVGATAVEIGVPTAPAIAFSFLIFAGASQLVLLELWQRHTPTLVLILTTLVVNLRLAMYSAAMAPLLRGLSRGWRWGSAYLLTDQVYVMSVEKFDKEPISARWYFLGVGFSLWVLWQASTMAGVLLGRTFPETWNLDFAVPLSFIALLIPSLKSRAAVFAACSAGGSMLFTRFLPMNLGLVTATLIGVAVGMLSDRRSEVG